MKGQGLTVRGLGVASTQPNLAQKASTVGVVVAISVCAISG